MRSQCDGTSETPTGTSDTCSVSSGRHPALSVTVCQARHSPPRQGPLASASSVFQRRKLRHRKVKKLAQGCTADPWHGWKLNPGGLAPENVLLTHHSVQIVW